ncbi:phage/plasmid replication domain-containing protein [Dickeya fangzhongdai]|uniref:phage/plasmid replication domain-containing protein n=1 Tax=Dickeya fangzhongdai TaxID=1778540 RepID=UPI003F5D2B84
MYNKAHELKLHALSKIENKFGKNSDEVRYLQRVIAFCEDQGVVRFEQKLKSRYLQKHGLLFWGLTDYSTLTTLHDAFISLDNSLMVTAMDFDTISEHLINQGVVDNTRSANTTAMYAIQWMHGHSFDFNKKQVQTHRARLRKMVLILPSAAISQNSARYLFAINGKLSFLIVLFLNGIEDLTFYVLLDMNCIVEIMK